MSVRVKVKQKDFERCVAQKNMSYSNLAENLGISRTYLSNIKNEKVLVHTPSARLRKRILEELGVEFDEIFEVVEKSHE